MLYFNRKNRVGVYWILTIYKNGRYFCLILRIFTACSSGVTITSWLMSFRIQIICNGRSSKNSEPANKGLAGIRFCVVGDEKQSIYMFRGAGIRYLTRYARNCSKRMLPIVCGFRTKDPGTRRSTRLAIAPDRPINHGRKFSFPQGIDLFL